MIELNINEKKSDQIYNLIRYIIKIYLYDFIGLKWGEFAEAAFVLKLFYNKNNQLLENKGFIHHESVITKCLNCGHYINFSTTDEVIGMVFGKQSSVR